MNICVRMKFTVQKKCCHGNGYSHSIKVELWVSSKISKMYIDTLILLFLVNVSYVHTGNDDEIIYDKSAQVM